MTCKYAFRVIIDPETSEPESRQYDLPDNTDLEDDITSLGPKVAKFIKGKLTSIIQCQYICTEHGPKGVAQLVLNEDDISKVEEFAEDKDLSLEQYVAENLMAAAVQSARTSISISFLNTGPTFSNN